MKQRILKFAVCDQRITTTDVSVVADSRNYLAAFFTFDSTWDGVEKTAVFSQGENVYNMLLEGDMCRVPAEVIVTDAFYVSVFGGDLITADKIRIEVVPSGLAEGVSPPIPTEDIYNQLVERVASEAADAASSAETAVTAAQMSQGFAHDASVYAESASGSVGLAYGYEQSAVNSMVMAEQYAQQCAAAVSDSQNYAMAAQGSAEAAYSCSLNAEEFVNSAHEEADRANVQANNAVTAAIEAGECAARAETAATRAETAAAGYKIISSGELDETTGGVASIKAEITEDITSIREFNFYLEFPVTEDMAGTSPYVNAHISGNANTKNMFFSAYGTGVVANKTYRSTGQAKAIKSADGYYIHGIVHLFNEHTGINTRGTAYNTICPWEITEGVTQYLNINMSNTTFPSGTKWVLEGR